MNIWHFLLSLALIALLPRLAYWLCARFRPLGFLGPSLLCFAGGIALSFVLPDSAPASRISDACVSLAIPFLLFSLDFRAMRHLAKPAVRSFALICICVVAVSVGAHLLFSSRMGADSAAIDASLAGLFVGGLVNMAAVGNAVGLPGDTLTLLNTAYIVAGTVYLGIAALALPPLARRFLPKYQKSESPTAEQDLADTMHAGMQRFRLSMLRERLPMIALAVGIVLASMGISYLCTGNTKDAVLEMLCITSLSIACSFIPRVRKSSGSYATGQYLIDMFCVAIGAMFHLSPDAEAGPVDFMLLMLFIQLAAAVLHLLLCRLFRIDADTALITSAAAIFSPAFIPPLAQFMKNRDVIAVGLLFSIFGFVVANYAGFAAYALMRLFC